MPFFTKKQKDIEETLADAEIAAYIQVEDAEGRIDAAAGIVERAEVAIAVESAKSNAIAKATVILQDGGVF